MDKKSAIIISVIGIVIYMGIMIFQKSPEEKYEKFKKKSYENKASIPYDKAYQLKINFDSTTDTDAQYIITGVLQEKLNKYMKPYGVNPVSYNKTDTGRLGIIQADVRCETQGYQGSGSALAMSGSIPTAISLKLKVDSYNGSSSWDGGFSESVEKIPSTTINVNTFSSVRKRHVSKMLEQIFGKVIGLRGKFKR